MGMVPRGDLGAFFGFGCLADSPVKGSICAEVPKAPRAGAHPERRWSAVIPLKDTQRSRRRPIVNWILIAANLLVFMYEVALPDRLLAMFTVRYGVIPRALLSPGSFRPGSLAIYAGWPSLLTSLFIHAGWVHLLGNMLYLYIFGDNVEDRLCRGNYLVFYLVCGAISSIGHIASAPGSTTPTVGASGAIAGVLGAYFIMYPRARVLALVPVGFFLSLMEVPAIVFLFLWFITNLFSGMASLGAPVGGGVAWWAHIGGFVAGMLGALLVGRRSRVQG